MWHLFLRNTLNSWKPKLGNTQPKYIACWPTVCTTSSTQTERIIEFPLAKESWEYLLVFFINIIDFTLSDGKHGVECAETESWIRNVMFTLQCDSRQRKIETGKCPTNCWVTQQQLTHCYLHSITYRQHDQIDICRVTVLHSQRDNSLEMF